MQLWLRESLKRRLHKSLACDWMRPETEKHFPLREFYVQLEWQKKVRHALSTEKVTLHSIHELIEQMTEQNQPADGPKSEMSESRDTTVLESKEKQKNTIRTKLSRIFKFSRQNMSMPAEQNHQTTDKGKTTSNVIIEGKISLQVSNFTSANRCYFKNLTALFTSMEHWAKRLSVRF